MPHITITPSDRPFAITAGAEVLGRSTRVLDLREGSYPVTHYVPRQDIDMSKLQRSPRQTSCPHKGLCSYFHVQTAAGLLENAVWSYETPIGDAGAIAGHLAFYPDKVRVTAA